MSGISICATLGGNTKRAGCDVRMGRIKYPLFTIDGEFTEAQLADSESFEAALQAKMLLANGDNNKIYAFPEMRDATNNTGDPNFGTLADGFEEPLNEAVPKYLLKSTPGVCLQQAMASFNGWPGKNYFVDENNILFYKVKTDGGGKGFTVGSLYTNPPAPKGSGDVQTANTRLGYGSIDEFKSKIGALKLDFNVGDLLNMQDVELTDEELENVSGSLNNTFLIGARTLCENNNIYDTYKSLLTVAYWKAYQSDGTNIPRTSVTPVDGSKAWQVVLDPTTYNAMPVGTVFYIDWVSPTTLNAAGIEGIEAKRIRFVKF